MAVLPIEVHVETGLAQSARLGLLVCLAPDKVFDVGMVDVEHDHLGRTSCGTTRLDRPGRRVGATHERHGAGRRATGAQMLLRRADLRQVESRAGTVLEDGAVSYTHLTLPTIYSV